MAEVWRNRDSVLLRAAAGDLVLTHEEAFEIQHKLTAKWTFSGEKLEAARARMEHARQARKLAAE